MTAVRHLPTNAVGWRARVRGVAPMIPYWLEYAIGTFLADERVNSDGLLSLADALEQASAAATTHNQLTMARELHRLADLPRLLAPSRADLPAASVQADEPKEAAP